METYNIHQTLFFATDAVDLYTCIMDARKHSSFTGDEAKIEDKEGSDFSVFGGYAHGTNRVLERGKKIVQTWVFNEADWPANHLSEVVFVFTNKEGGCEVDFYHTDIPVALSERIESGWNEYYWNPLRIYLER